jgi:hypothetical protein
MKKILLSMLIAGFAFSENFVNLQVTNDTVMFEGQAQIVNDKPIYARGGYLINSKEDAVSDFGYIGLKTEGQAIGVDIPVKISLMVDVVHIKDNTASPVGLGLSTYLKQFSMPVFLRASYEYAPKILSYEDAEKFSKLKVETGIRFIENGEAFVGYRKIDFDETYINNMYVGVGFVF